MEQNEREHIRKNLPDLLHLTICNVSLFAICRAKDIISREDEDHLEIQRMHGGHYSAAKLFYEIVQTRPGAFDVVLEALKETKQAGAVKILKELKRKGAGATSSQPRAAALPGLSSEDVSSDQPSTSRGFNLRTEMNAGDRSCSCNCILQKIETSTRSHEFFMNWRNMADLMNISIGNKIFYSVGIFTNFYTPKEAFCGILEIWTGDQGINAIVGKLVGYMDKCGFGDVAGTLETLNRCQIVLKVDTSDMKK